VSRIRFDEPVVLVRSAALVKVDHTRAVTEFLEQLLRTPALNAAMLRAAKSVAQANLFQLTLLGMAARFLFFLALLILPFAVVHDSADRGTCLGCHFHQVEVGITSATPAFFEVDDPHLLVLIIDQTNGRNTDLVVATEFFTGLLEQGWAASNDGPNLHETTDQVGCESVVTLTSRVGPCKLMMCLPTNGASSRPVGLRERENRPRPGRRRIRAQPTRIP